MLCLHCLNDNPLWTDECCPICRDLGHVSPWAYHACPACNAEILKEQRADLNAIRVACGLPPDPVHLEVEQLKLEKEGAQRMYESVLAGVVAIKKEMETMQAEFSRKLHTLEAEIELMKANAHAQETRVG